MLGASSSSSPVLPTAQLLDPSSVCGVSVFDGCTCCFHLPETHTHAQRTWTWLATWMPLPSPAPTHGAHRTHKCRLLPAGTEGQQCRTHMTFSPCSHLGIPEAPSWPLCPPGTPAQIARLLLSPRVSHMLAGPA